VAGLAGTFLKSALAIAFAHNQLLAVTIATVRPGHPVVIVLGVDSSPRINFDSSFSSGFFWIVKRGDPLINGESIKGFFIVGRSRIDLKSQEPELFRQSLQVLINL